MIPREYLQPSGVENSMNRRLTRAALFILATLNIAITATAHAQTLRMPKIFADHMVLQRGTPVRFWGWARPGTRITVEIQSARTAATADAAGNWELMYPPTRAGGPYEIMIMTGEGGGEKIFFQDVYFGDVWLAGGQSNMEWKVAQTINAENEINDGNYPKIRYFEVPNEISPSPLTDIAGAGPQWVSASPATVAQFSAVAWFFAKHNHKEKNVAVGIIDSTWGGTPAEAWIDAQRLLDNEDYKNQAGFVLDPAHDWKQILADNAAQEQRKWQMIGDKERVLKLKVHETKYDDSKWQTVQLPNTRPLSDFAWLRKSFELSAEDLTLPATLELGELVQNAMLFVNGRLIAEENWLNKGATYRLEAGLLKKGRNVIALRLANDWSNEAYAGKPGRMYLDLRDRKINLEGEWRHNNTLEPGMPLVLRYNWSPGFLYNAMIHPIQGYGIRGAIWYQGESNADKPKAYIQLFKTLIADWRAKWKQGDFPFLFVQLASFNDKDTSPNWPLLREAQAKALELPNTGMAVTMDIGDPEDIHPRNKQDVGRRLWLNARKLAFNETLHYTGPVYKNHKISGDKIILNFDHVGRTFMTPRPQNIQGFVIAGEDRQFHPAQARFKKGVMTVWSPEVPSPVAVRYAWAAYFDVDVFSWEMLPMAPFRTDNWEL
jgi:sialate O-acetylesterase